MELKQGLPYLYMLVAASVGMGITQEGCQLWKDRAFVRELRLRNEAAVIAAQAQRDSQQARPAQPQGRSSGSGQPTAPAQPSPPLNQPSPEQPPSPQK